MKPEVVDHAVQKLKKYTWISVSKLVRAHGRVFLESPSLLIHYSRPARIDSTNICRPEVVGLI
jgi:hypothetical protein